MGASPEKPRAARASGPHGSRNGLPREVGPGVSHRLSCAVPAPLRASYAQLESRIRKGTQLELIATLHKGFFFFFKLMSGGEI